MILTCGGHRGGRETPKEHWRLNSILTPNLNNTVFLNNDTPLLRFRTTLDHVHSITGCINRENLCHRQSLKPQNYRTYWIIGNRWVSLPPARLIVSIAESITLYIRCQNRGLTRNEYESGVSGFEKKTINDLISVVMFIPCVFGEGFHLEAFVPGQTCQR